MKSVIFLLTLLVSSSIYAEDTDISGKKLHDEACVKCHGSEMYTREDRFVSSLEELNKQVARCQHNLGITWFDDERGSVVQFLNSEHYKFK